MSEASPVLVANSPFLAPEEQHMAMLATRGHPSTATAAVCLRPNSRPTRVRTVLLTLTS